MWIIITTKDGEQICYGPFTSQYAAARYAVKHGLNGMYIVVKLHDSSETME